MLRVCVFLVSVCVFGVGSFSGRGFFCRDPDTGKLYAVNATWPSRSFCGNYHCKLRRKNITATEYAPLRVLNITNIKLVGENGTENIFMNHTKLYKKDEVSKNVINADKKTEPDILDGLISPLVEKMDNTIDDKNDTEKDRYLSDTEIRSLTELLHTVKKSDLDAIVEIYNLAQDIYKEIDKTSSDHVLNEAIFTTKTLRNIDYKSNLIRKAKKIGDVSYWYEPLSKIRPAAELIRSDVSRAETIGNDVLPVMSVIPAELLNIRPNLKVPPKPTNTNPTPSVITTSLPTSPKHVPRKIDTYFTRALSKKDFGKLPYYYPVSNFQRQSSYTHQQQKPNHANLPTSKPMYQPVTYKPVSYGPGKYQREIKPSILLPYPFYNIQHYNWSYPENIYYRGNRMNKLKQQLREKEKTPNVGKNYGSKPVNAVLMNPDLENFQDLEIRPIKKEDKRPGPHAPQAERLKPDWQTDSLPKHILDEVRAHVDKQKLFIHPFPLRRKVKLERVGKVIKMDEITRNKRSSNNFEKEERQLEPELYEIYIERTTCHADYTIPGYFRYGNLTQPYPDCCPQRL